jgi:CTP:phosphocholine cytidylyltransferase-like protein
MDCEGTMIQQLEDFLSTFRRLNVNHKRNRHIYQQMEQVIGEFSFFILNKENRDLWNCMEHQNNTTLTMLAEQLREQSAFCVWDLEKYRAIEFKKNRQSIADYFKNIEGCIETEFGSFEISLDSKVLMIGVGAFPMTPIVIAKKTGAEIVGIDIDSEAIDLARAVVTIADKNARIAIKERTVDQLEFTKMATHIIFASTVKEKFAILKQLHPLTNENAVVAMRYGNGFKSLFNYPLENIDSSLWKIVNNVSQEENIFDIALYKKADGEY